MAFPAEETNTSGSKAEALAPLISLTIFGTEWVSTDGHAWEKTSATSLTGLTPVQARKIIALLRKAASQIVPEMSQAIFTHMDTELLERAKNAESNEEQNE